jgi:hypothetical protein
MENDNWELHHKKINDFFEFVIKDSFPNSKIQNSESHGSPTKPPNSFKGIVSPKNLFVGTRYEIPENCNLIHYTDFHSLLSILNSGFFRMSEFKNFKDKSEFIYSSNFLNHPPFSNLKSPDIENLKKDLFGFSSCLSNDDTKRNHYMWNMYADNAKGVCIEFQIKLNNPSYTFGKILYGNENLDIIDRIKNQTEIFMINNKNFTVSNFIQFISTVLSFHKSKKYHYENEIRIFHLRNKFMEDVNIYQDLNSNFDKTNFCKIYHDISKHPNYKTETCDKTYFNLIPRIEIKNIILGYNLSNQQKNNIKMKIDEIKSKFGYNFNISHINEEEEIIDITKYPHFY